MKQIQKRDLRKSIVSFKHFYFQCLNVLVMYSESAIFCLKFFKFRITVIIYYPSSSSVKLVDFVIGRSTTEHPYNWAIFKLWFKE